MVFVDYCIANIYQIITTKIKIKKPDRATVEEMVKETISYAIETYDIEKAKDADGTFKTHLTWKALARVTEYARAFKKATDNKLNTADEEFASSLEANTDLDMLKFCDTNLDL